MSTAKPRAGAVGPALHLHLECNFSSVRRGAAQVRAFLLGHGLPEKDVWSCELAFVEGCNNAIQHTPAANAHQQLLVELSWHRTHVELRINDHSEGFEFPKDVQL